MSYQRRKKGQVKASVSIRLSEELLQQIDDAAEADNRTRSAWLANLIDEKLEQIAPKKLVAYKKGGYKTVKPSETKTIRFPIECLGSVAAGATGSDEERERILIPVDYTQDPECYALRVNGASMEPEIPDGSIIVVRSHRSKGFPKRGTIVVYADGTGTTLKRFNWSKQPDHPDADRFGNIPILETINPDFNGVETIEDGVIQAVLVEVVS